MLFISPGTCSGGPQSVCQALSLGDAWCHSGLVSHSPVSCWELWVVLDVNWS